jgi:hypothetical protein
VASIVETSSASRRLSLIADDAATSSFHLSFHHAVELLSSTMESATSATVFTVKVQRHHTLQSELSASIKLAMVQQLKSVFSSDNASLAWFTSLQCESAGMFLESLPKEDRLSFTNAQFSISVNRRLFRDLPSLGFGFVCNEGCKGACIDRKGIHLTSGCNNQGHRILTHDVICDAMSSLFTYNGINIKREEKRCFVDDANPSNAERPDISCRHPEVFEIPMLLDITVTGVIPLSQSSTTFTTATPLVSLSQPGVLNDILPPDNISSVVPLSPLTEPDPPPPPPPPGEHPVSLLPSDNSASPILSSSLPSSSLNVGRSLTSRGAARPLRAANKMISAKNKQYKAMAAAHGFGFTPIVFESTGRLHTSGIALLNVISSHAATIRSIPPSVLTRYMLKVISCTMQKAQANSILFRSRLLHGSNGLSSRSIHRNDRDIIHSDYLRA